MAALFEHVADGFNALTTTQVSPAYFPFTYAPSLHAARVSIAFQYNSRPTKLGQSWGTYVVGYLIMSWGGTVISHLILSLPPPQLYTIQPYINYLTVHFFLTAFFTWFPSALQPRFFDTLLFPLDAALRVNSIAGTLSMVAVGSPLPINPLLAGSPLTHCILGAVASAGGGQSATALGLEGWIAGTFDKLDVWVGAVIALLYDVLTAHPAVSGSRNVHTFMELIGMEKSSALTPLTAKAVWCRIKFHTPSCFLSITLTLFMAKRAAQDDATRPRKKTKAAAKRETRDKLKLAEHKKSISGNMTKLKKVCGGYKTSDADNQADALDGVTSEIVKWLTDIHAVIQEGEEFTVAISCLSHCTKVLQTVSRLEYAYDYTDLDDYRFIFQGASGNILFDASDTGHIERALNWLWRELLIADASNASSDVLAELGRLGIKDKIFKLFPVGNNATDPDGALYFAAHWTPDMHVVADQLVSAGINEKLTEFAAKPSLKVYNDVVTDQLKPALIDALRKDIARGASRSVPLDDALKIYSMNGLIDDIISLVPLLTQANVPDFDSTMRLVVKTFSRVDLNPDHKDICYNLIYEGLLLAQQRIFDHLADLHPGLQDAKLWLQEKVLTKYKKRILLAERKPPFDQTAVTLNGEVLEFIKIMTEVDDEYEEVRLEEARLDRRYERENSDSEDDHYETDIQGRSDSSYPTLNLRLWLSLFCEWPRPEELTGIWDKVKWRDGADPFGMYGITPALIKE
ncbi:hypothetical protein ONZ45_g12623 [Pleurotus djamor]|nr:hypothetical protein ONZ45_g12623 [Pleurotus djamor]